MSKSLTRRAERTPRVQLRAGRIFWEPSASLRRHGYKSQALGTLTGAALDQADELNASADDFLSAKTAARPAAQTLAAMLASYQASDAFAKLAARTRRDYARHLARVTPALLAGRADQLTRRALDRWHADLATTSGEDARNSLAALRAALAWAVARHHMATNPALGISAAPRQRRRRIATREELWTMIRTAERMGLRSVAAVALTAPAIMQRVSDTLGLTRRQIDAGVLYMRQAKTGEELSFRLHALVIDRLGTLPDQDAPLFPSEETGGAYSIRAFERAWDKVRTAAAKDMPSLIGADPAVREPTLQGELAARDLRRSGMVWAAQSGAQVPQICSISGHTLQSGLEILETYLPRQRLLADQAIAKLDLIRTPTVDDIGAHLLAS
jgi:hypothetical protein